MIHKKIKHYINRYRYHRTHRMLPELDGGFGACGQDILVYNLLGKKADGVFVDIGANDGITISNTLFFEKLPGWNGIAIEPIPKIYKELEKNRNCHTVNGCITQSAGKAKFLEMVGGPNMLSTLAVNNVGLTARRLRKNAKRHNATIVEIEVACFTLHSLLDKFGYKEIDFLSVDTEGGELDILKSIDFVQTRVNVISVENNYYTDAVRKHLESRGFLYIGTFKVDEIYVFGGTELQKAMEAQAVI